MATTESVTTEQAQAIAATAAIITETHEQVADALTNYVNSNVTATVSVGPTGGNMQGNIHYTGTPEQVYFHMDGDPTEYYGLFAGPGGLPLVGALPAAQLVGKTGRFKAAGFGGGGVLQLWVDGVAVFSTPIPLGGAGLFGWSLEGRVQFVRVH